MAVKACQAVLPSDKGYRRFEHATNRGLGTGIVGLQKGSLHQVLLWLACTPGVVDIRNLEVHRRGGNEWCGVAAVGIQDRRSTCLQDQLLAFLDHVGPSSTRELSGNRCVCFAVEFARLSEVKENRGQILGRHGL